MKNISLIVTALIFAAIVFPFLSLHAEEATPSVEFSYAGEPWGAGGFSEPSYKGGAMLLTEEVSARFDGCRITEVMIANGEFHNQTKAPVEIFFTHDLGTPAFYSFNSEMDMDRPKEYKSYPLSTPVEIHAGGPFFVGFVTWAAGWSTSDYKVSYPVWCDNKVHTDLPGGYIAFSETTGHPDSMEWKDEGYSGGQVCIRLKIEGENLPQNVVELSRVNMKDYVDPSAGTDAYIWVSNKGVNPITELDLSYTVFDQTGSVHFDFPEGLGYEETANMGFGVSVPQEGVNVPVTFLIEKVNGVVPSAYANTTESLIIHSLLPENGFDKAMVVEEASGRGCPWCVRGIVGLDEMFQKHGGEGFIPISAHHEAHGEDTAPFGYDAFWERYITSNPSCLINRNIARYGIADPGPTSLPWIYDEIAASRAIAEIRVNGYSEEYGCLSVESEVSFAFSEEDATYSVAYVITENHVGPILQDNSAYSGSAWGEMGGWELLPDKVMTYVDFLARGISDFDGTPLNPEGGIEAGKTYTHTDNVNMVKVRDRERLTLVAMVINDATGCIENAVRVPLSDLNAVEEISSSDAPVEYYDLSGRRISSQPTTGIYIERRGSTARKMAAIPQ